MRLVVLGALTYLEVRARRPSILIRQSVVFVLRVEVLDAKAGSG